MERERLASTWEEQETKVKAVETSLSTAASKFDAGLASLAILQCQQHSLALGMGTGEIVKGFHGSGRGGLVTPPSPRSLSADSNRPRQRRKNVSGSQGRSASRGTEVETIDCGAESESNTTSTHPSLDRPYTPSLPDESSDANADSDPLQKDSTDLNPNSLSSKKTSSIHQLNTPKSSVH